MAREMEYRPDPLLSALAQHRRIKTSQPIESALAWINPWPKPKELRSFKEFNLYWEGAHEEAERYGFRLEEFLLDEGMNPERLEQILRTRSIGGILLPPGGGVDYRRHPFHWDDFFVVRFGYSIAYPEVHLVTSDQFSNGLIAYENILRRGYRRIGMVTSAKMHTRFAAGYLFGQYKWNPDLRLPPLVLQQESSSEDRRRLKAWLTASRPDAIMTDVGILRDLLVEVGWNAPDDIGLAVMSILDGNADAGINQNSRAIGKAAVRLITSLLHHNERGVPVIYQELLIKGSWVDGKSLPQK